MNSREFRRPQPGGSEADLWRDAQAWERGHISQPSVPAENIVHVKRPHSPDRLSENRHPSTQTHRPVSPPVSAAVLKDTVSERDPHARPTFDPPQRSALAFPAVFKAQFEPSAEPAPAANPSVPTAKKRSLFARQVARKDQPITARHPNPGASEALGVSSFILQGSGLTERPGEAQVIHNENVARLGRMTSEEIQRERNDLCQQMSSQTLAFVTTLRQKKMAASAGKSSSPATPSPLALSEPETMDVSIPSTSTPPPLSKAANEMSTNFGNLGRVEKEKLAWMADIPEGSAGSNPTPTDGYSARFDFQGRLVPLSEDIPVQAGLHHHGEEEKRAGYTVEELLILARSRNPQQKVLALDTLAQIVKRFKQGTLDGILDQNLVDQVIRSDIFFIMRTSLDDPAPSIREATLLLFRHLLDNPEDELMLDFHYTSTYGHCQPSLASKAWSDPSQRAEMQETMAELKDDELLKLDVILGLLRMDLLQRFAYILNQLEPTASAKKNILATVIRIARHSLSAASQIVHHEMLMKSIMSVMFTDTDTVCRQLAAKVVRILIARNRSLLVNITKTHDIKPFLLKYLALESENGKLTGETFRLWDTCLQYGECADIFSDLFPILMKYLLSIRGATDPMSMNQQETSPWTLERPLLTALLFKVLNSCILTDAIPWNQLQEVVNVLQIVYQNLVSLLRNGSLLCSDAIQEGSVFGSCSQALASGILRYANERGPLDLIPVLNEMATKIIVPFLKSGQSSRLVGKLKQFSAFLSLDKDGRERDTENLVSLSAISWQGELVRTLNKQSPFPVLNGLTRVLFCIVKITQNGAMKLSIAQWVQAKALAEYLVQVCQCSHGSIHSNWFLDEEISFLFYCVLLRTETLPNEVGSTWQLAHVLMSKCQVKHSELLKNLAERVVFKVDQTLVEHGLLGMRMNESVGKSNSLEALQNLQDVRALYMRHLPRSHGRFPILFQQSTVIQTLSVSNNGEILLPSDWIYVPLIQLSRPELQREQIPKESGSRQVELSLQWIYICLLMRPLTSIPEVTLHFSRLATLLLSNETFFLDSVIGQWLSLDLTQVLRDTQGLLDFSQAIPGIESAKEFYQELCGQYAAVSYGDKLFSLFLILPTSGKNTHLRLTLWKDYTENLRLMQLDPQDLPQGFSVNSFCCGKDLDASSLRSYASAILLGVINPKRNPLLFQIAQNNIMLAQDSEDQAVRAAFHQVEAKLYDMDVFKK
ncbi:hypothetical protein TCAL_05592 [Tigriopus californicus]|uniref:RNA polymerase II-associated protein 1 C-terminal domain-containing protein n=1 Tax=Tigriopus californicus TaxID=6832 RepID=A0A553NEI7_TIGCA|nr:RNA polymerase II-associated protein 1-like [Tigriopus californicus]TRY63779.1 hypothetical protein TCAL_05592 [Tigriopus californicus]